MAADDPTLGEIYRIMLAHVEDSRRTHDALNGRFDRQVSCTTG